MNLSPDDVRDRVADLLPSVDPESPAFLDACETFAASLNMEHTSEQSAETERAHAAGLLTMRTPDARSFDGLRGGGVHARDIAAPALESWRGEHAVKRGRSKKGATAQVLRYGDAPVIGRFDHDASGRPILATPEDVADWSFAAARMLASSAERGELRRHRAGWSGIGIARLTDAASALDDQMPRMLGTDVAVFAQVVPGDRSSRSPVAAQRSDLSGLASHPTLGRFVAHAGANTAHTSRLAWTPRYRLTFKARKSDPTATTSDVPTVHHITRTFTVGPWWSMAPHAWSLTPRTMTVQMPVTIDRTVALPSACDGVAVRTIATDGHTAVRTGPAERVHHGRTTIVRVARVDRDKRGAAVKRGAVQARTIGTVDAPSTVDGWAIVLDSLNRGERIVCTADDGRVTITRGTTGRYSATDSREHRAQTIRSARTAQSVALKLAD